MGGKSSSSSSSESTQTTETVTGSATGTVGDVYQGKDISITTQFPTEAVGVFNELIKLSGQAIDAALQAGGESLKVVQQFGESTKAPDVALAKEGNKTNQTVIALVAGAAVVATFLFTRGK